jgi:hypothetical protein
VAPRWHRPLSADEYPDEIEVPSLGLRMKCSKRGMALDGLDCLASRMHELERWIAI